MGIITSDVGKPTIKPIINPWIHFSKKLGTKPKFIKVRIKDRVKAMANDINTPNKTVEYFLFIFIMITVLFFTPTNYKINYRSDYV